MQITSRTTSILANLPSTKSITWRGHPTEEKKLYTDIGSLWGRGENVTPVPFIPFFICVFFLYYWNGKPSARPWVNMTFWAVWKCKRNILGFLADLFLSYVNLCWAKVPSMWVELLDCQHTGTPSSPVIYLVTALYKQGESCYPRKPIPHLLPTSLPGPAVESHRQTASGFPIRCLCKTNYAVFWVLPHGCKW